MRIKFVLWVASICVAVVALAATDSADWNAKMLQMKTTLTDLTPFLYDQKAFQDPKNRERIDKLAEQLNEIARDLDQRKIHLDVSAPVADPGVEYMSYLLHDKIERASAALKNNQREYAQGLLRTATASCISCHTRSDHGPQFPMAQMQEPLKALSPVDRLLFFAATRQFDAALQEYRQNVAGPKASPLSPLEFEKASRVVMATAVRVKQDANKALQVVQMISQAKAGDSEFKNTMTAWRKAILAWTKEKPTGKANDDFVVRARDLLEQAKKAQKFPSDARGDIQYLRATVFLHNYLQENPKGARASEALYSLGVAYDALRDLGFWSLHEMYYEACIRQQPHSPQAQQCYRRFEDSMTFGYTGSGGTQIPSDVRRHMSELQALADPVAAK